jgi:hypothetical protein
MRKAIHDELKYANINAVAMDINRIFRPSVMGVIINKVFIDIDIISEYIILLII